MTLSESHSFLFLNTSLSLLLPLSGFLNVLVLPVSPFFPLSLSASLFLPVPPHFPSTSTSASSAFLFSPDLPHPSQLSFVYPAHLPTLSSPVSPAGSRDSSGSLEVGGRSLEVGGWAWRRGPAPRCVCECVAVTRRRRRGGKLGRPKREASGSLGLLRSRAPARSLSPAEAQAGRRRRRAAWRACWRIRCEPCSTSRSSRPSCRTSRALSTHSASASTSWSGG